MEHLMAVETLFPKGVYFATDKGKTLQDFCESRDDPFLCVCEIPHNLFSNELLKSSSIQLLIILSMSLSLETYLVMRKPLL